MSDDELKVMLFCLKDVYARIESNRLKNERKALIVGQEYILPEPLQRVLRLSRRLITRIESRLPAKPEGDNDPDRDY